MRLDLYDDELDEELKEEYNKENTPRKGYTLGRDVGNEPEHKPSKGLFYTVMGVFLVILLSIGGFLVVTLMNDQNKGEVVEICKGEDVPYGVTNYVFKECSKDDGTGGSKENPNEVPENNSFEFRYDSNLVTKDGKNVPIQELKLEQTYPKEAKNQINDDTVVENIDKLYKDLDVEIPSDKELVKTQAGYYTLITYKGNDKIGYLFSNYYGNPVARASKDGFSSSQIDKFKETDIILSPYKYKGYCLLANSKITE